MARDAGDYILRGLKERKAEGSAAEFWEKGLESLFEPLRAGTWFVLGIRRCGIQVELLTQNQVIEQLSTTIRSGITSGFDPDRPLYLVCNPLLLLPRRLDSERRGGS